MLMSINFSEKIFKMTVVGTNSNSGPDATGVLVKSDRFAEGARSIFGVAQRFSGAVLVLAALGLWVIPGASWSADLALVKLTFSLALGFSGLALWQMGASSERVEIELDTETYEARVIINVMGRAIRVLNCRFNDLQRAEIDGDSLRLWGQDGHFLAEVDMCHPQVRRRLITALRKTGLLEV